MVAAIGRTDLLRLMESESAQIVDVLPAREYEEAHLPGAISIPLRELAASSTAHLSQSDPVVVYCHDGL